MKGFKPTGYGPSAGFKFPASFGFTGSTGAYTNVSPYVRQKPRVFKDGGYVSEKLPDPGSALERRARSSNNLDQVSGGKTPIRPGYKDGGKKKTPKKMRKAYGGPIIVRDNSPREEATADLRRKTRMLAADRDFYRASGNKQKAAAFQQYLNEQKGAPILDESWRHRAYGKNRKPSSGALSTIMKEKFMEDGGRVVYGSSSKGFGSDIRKTGEFIGQIPRLVKEAAQSSFRRTQQDVADVKRRRIDRIADGTASNYARGGKMKRMGYANGGDVDAQDRLRVLKGYYDRPQDTDYGAARGIIRNMAGLVIDRKTQAQRQQYVRDQSQRKADAITSPNHRVNLKTTSIKARYAKGGAAHSDEAQDRPMMKRVAQEVIGEHVRYPAPKGHKGLGKMCK